MIVLANAAYGWAAPTMSAVKLASISSGSCAGCGAVNQKASVVTESAGAPNTSCLCISGPLVTSVRLICSMFTRYVRLLSCTVGGIANPFGMSTVGLTKRKAKITANSPPARIRLGWYGGGPAKWVGGSGSQAEGK